ncbi:TetR/AcrR family transcriptional regulator [Agromyces sp. ISL-38]|uniref:TetR/AcrR family transcriptional regulator n=1 Tax=Agromyces sp. ISL-38 TaxID=2819107 RepID=UPI001BE94106|nr:TetR/AcrR family transcriptional regulator [Agromyces sp. ISL-38]MBT2500825.1 TetR/AcrR family transcriptional regulator [Agromyces sp. ISL-38]
MKETPEARGRILDAAERLFAERGFDATPTSSIAKLAAVPKGLLFYYFPTKSDLLCALVGERLDLGPIDANLLIEPGDPVRALLNLERKLSEIQADSPVLRVIIWREQRTHPEVRAKLREHRVQVQSVVERVLSGSVLRPIAARTLRTAAVAWVAILTLRPSADHAGVATDDAAPDLQALAELICDGIGGSGLA